MPWIKINVKEKSFISIKLNYSFVRTAVDMEVRRLILLIEEVLMEVHKLLLEMYGQ